ncbi:F0F1 ATP synthase subunit gamma [Rhodovarius crocodyli]|uniref:ATP synthase gamma chain n=1 Tax=Rhodovarius crocodyli TaxID=1979269 RepID=A0A437MH69_9PROT|nr:F0F1 ATP synthase subunit gamma [Rhodovarius crocodyli]RVT96987.1 F0F1 ATP synthase subunit gamma [Rhodovarius crocodyli]
MPSLKSLRLRINSVKSTKKITEAMKLVAAAKLRRAQQQAEAARPYAERMARMLGALGAAVAGEPEAPKLLVGTGKTDTYLLVVVSAERGLCGPFNTNVSRFARNRIRDLEAAGKTVKIMSVGRKGAAYLKREFRDRFVGEVSFANQKRITFDDASSVAASITTQLEDGAFDVCELIYNRFVSVISQTPSAQQLIPAEVPESGAATAQYEFEPSEEEILTKLLPRNLAIQVYRALLESGAGFYGSQMAAMDSATRNAGQMINKLTLNYNRTRQANITRELIEIISGAEAV